MKRLLPILIVLALVPSHARALDTGNLRSLCAMPLAVDACARTGRVAPDQLARYASRLNDADVPPPLFVETIRYAPVALQQPDFFPFVDSEVSQGVVGDALVTVIEQRVRGYGYDVRRGSATPPWVLSDNYIPRFESSRTTVRTSPYDRAYDTRYDNAPRYDRRTILYLVEMPLAVANVSDYGVPQDRLARFCGTLNRGYLPPEQFIDTVRYAPQVIVDRPDFVPFVDAQIGNGVVGIRLFNVINRQLPSYQAPRQAFTPSYVLNDQYVPPPVRTRWAQARVNPSFAQQPAFIPQPMIQQPMAQQRPTYPQPVAQPTYVPQPQPAYARQQQQQRFRQQAPAVVRSAPQPAMIQSPQVVQMPAPREVRIPPGQAKKEARQAQVEAQVPEQGHGKGRQRVVVQQQPQPVVIAPPPMASAAPPPAPVMVAPPQQQDNGHGHGKGPGGEGPPGQQKDKGKDKGGKGHGKD
ncbi:MAG TPA: hypothetical protein VHY33_02565 [Thermoanaerobaculia bacterium]|jgi:hypothetical protein|nr:hypothetical protein [Thermoanaerobaculia bacterium]